jgi:hypothetical protein
VVIPRRVLGMTRNGPVQETKVANVVECIMQTNISIFDEIVPEFLPVRSMPIFRRAHVDGVCSRCGRWHTIALQNGLPSCFEVEKKSDRRNAVKGCVQ